MAILSCGLCWTWTLLLSLTWDIAHSQDCSSYVNITGSGLERLETGTNVCFICFFDGPGVIDTGTQWTIGNPAQAIPSGDGSVIDGVLVIFNLTTVFDQNLMFLLCEAGDGSVYETAISLSIFVPPTIDGLTVVNETDTLMLLCDTSQPAPVPSPSWLDPSGTEVSTVASLVIENMNRSQAGLYTCVIMQGLNELSANVTVTVQYAPDVNTTVSSPHLSPRGQPLSLSCDYDGEPPPDITWLFEGTTRMDSDPRVTILSTETHSDFTLNGLMESEAGLYSCRASNLLGTDSVEIMVTVQVPPDPPSGLEVTNQTTTTLSLKWTIGDDGLSPITGIEIEYHNPEEDFIEIEDVPEVVETYTLVNLRPSTVYIIRVYIVNAVGQSEPSTTTGKTGGGLLLMASTVTMVTALLLSLMIV